ncbi:uncharacterized protein LOC128858808 [Anastrepha ludens]|uniref:uncharacterized protein LOC128858808 n=1 Tax=Anastrepha ludens TaxID=28586 RepID=UPI0023B072B9|nr:uncharacterized protein LOC128858808 [Anastrepha ludens]
MMKTTKIYLFKILLLLLCAVQAATSLPMELVTIQQAEVPFSRQATAVAVVNEALQPSTPAVGGEGDERAVDVPLLMPLRTVDELPPRDGKCVEVGKFCHLAEECCTRRCLTYAKRCVT